MASIFGGEASSGLVLGWGGMGRQRGNREGPALPAVASSVKFSGITATPLQRVWMYWPH